MLKSNLPSNSYSGIRLDGNRDMAQVYDPYKKEWKDWEQTGAIILPSTITITTITLNGKPVTCVLGDYSQTTVFVDGAAVFQDIFATGTATITSGEFSIEVQVTETGINYTAELEEVAELVLWEAGYQNGATLDRGYLSYASDTGFLENKTFCFTMNTNLSNACNIFQFYKGSNNAVTTRYVNSSGVTSASASSSAYGSGSIYKFSFNSILASIEEYLTTAHTLRVAFWSNLNGTTYTIASYTSKIWLE